MRWATRRREQRRRGSIALAQYGLAGGCFIAAYDNYRTGDIKNGTIFLGLGIGNTLFGIINTSFYLKERQETRRTYSF